MSEGFAAGLALRDTVSPRRGRRWKTFADRHDRFIYLSYVGFGWARGLVPFRRHGGGLKGPDPLLAELAVDGYGFQQAFFRPRRYLAGGAYPRDLAPDERPAFDQGIGRCLWFLCGARPGSIAKSIAALAPTRSADLWAGVGLACAYAGGASEGQIAELRTLATGFEAELAQGAAFGAEARRRGGNIADHTRLACRLLCGMDVEPAADLAIQSRANLVPEEPGAYQVWRKTVIQAFVALAEDREVTTV